MSIFTRGARRHAFAGGVAISAVTAALLTASPAFAQDSDAAEVDESNAIIVTGSRIKKTGFNEPTPATVFDVGAVQDLGIVNAGEIMKLIPQNSAFQSDATAGITAGPDVGSSFANLRGLNPGNGTRTLTLVNTRRFVPTSTGGAVDLNLIPTAMIKRVETVTGGASAAYGSDAIAGVVNIILDTDLDGFRAQMDYGQTFRGDGKGYHGSLVYGTDLGDRGHIVIGAEYERKKGIGDCADVRGWCAEGWDRFTNSRNILSDLSPSGYNVVGSPGYGLPNYIIAPNSKQSYNDAHGALRNRTPAPAAARNYRFNDDGTGIVEFDPGQYVAFHTFGPRQGGDGESTYADSDIQTPLERYVGYIYGDYELSDALTAYTEITYADRTTSNTGQTAGPRSTFFVKPDNAFLPAELVTLLDGASFSLGKDVDAQVPALNVSRAKVWRVVAGLTGDIGSSWNYDAYYQFGSNKRHQDGRYSRVNTEFKLALDAVDEGLFLNNVANGNIVCRETLMADPDPRSVGCQPMNLFGLDNLSDAARDYAYRPVVEDYDYTQHVFAATINGEVYEGFGAGPVAVATGVEYRSETGDVTHGNIANYNDYAFTYGLDYSGKINVLETFAEVNLPVFQNSALGEFFELNGAVRWTQNKANNTATNEKKTTESVSYKLSGSYEIGAGIRLRASRSRDIRAAGFRELFNQNVPTESGSASGKVDNPAIAGSPAIGDDDTPILNGGSFALSPEKADTTTAGIVFQPDFIPGLRLSADWYQIALKDSVTTINGQQIVDFCEENGTFCDRITYASPTDITFIDARQINLDNRTVRGFDFEMSYIMSLSDVFENAGGSLSLRLLANNQYSFDVEGTDYAGQSGPISGGFDFNPAPKWIWNGFLSYDNDGFNTTLSMRKIGKGIYNVNYIGPEDEGYDPSLPNSVTTNRVDGATYFGLAMSYQFDLGSGSDRNFEVFGAIDNMFDTKPPVAPGGGGGGGSNYPTNPVYFDTFGSRFRAGVRLSF